MAVTALELINQLDKGSPLPVYFLFGAEDFFQIEMIHHLAHRLITPDNREFNLETFDARDSGPGDWLGAARTLSFLGGDKLVVVRNLDDASLDETQTSALLNYVADPAPEACLVMTALKADRKRKLFKALCALPGAGECVSPKEGELVNWLRQRAKNVGCTLNADAARLMVERVGLKPGRLAGELEKVITYTGQAPTVKAADVAEVVGEIKLETAFALTDALRERNAGRALRLLRNQLDHGEEPVKLLGMIVAQYRLIWLVKHYQAQHLAPEKIAKEIGSHPFPVKQAARNTRNFSDQQLRKGFDALFRADRELKTTGKPAEGVLESLILNLCSTSG